MRTLYTFLPAAFSLAVSYAVRGQDRTLQLAGENTLSVNNRHIPARKIQFTRASGDWFVTGSDGNATLALEAKINGEAVRLDIGWDGNGRQHAITADNNKDDGVSHHSFNLSMDDKNIGQGYFIAKPEGHGDMNKGEDDEVRVIVDKMDNTSLQARFAGKVHYNNSNAGDGDYYPVLEVSGTIQLTKRAGAGRLLFNSHYRDCDSVIHDKLINAEGRSPSECEAAYDLDIRKALQRVFEPVVNTYQQQGWVIAKQTGLSPLVAVGRGSEKDVFNTTYELLLQLSPESETYQRFNQQQEEMSVVMRQHAQAGGDTKGDYEKFMQFGRTMREATSIRVYVSVNNHNAGFANFKGGSRVERPGDGVYVVRSPYVQARTGGGAEDAGSATFALIGNWKAPLVQNLGEGEEKVNAQAVLVPGASHLLAQNVLIRIECKPEVATDVLQRLNCSGILAALNR